MIISVMGLGLIGASLAKAIKKYTDHTVIGLDRTPAVLETALADKTIDIIGTPEDLQRCDLTIISIYPKVSIDFVKKNADKFKKGSVVIDACGIKSKICGVLTEIAEKNGFEFIGAHPMAGKEKSGYAYSDADLFRGASMILTPADGSASDNVNMLKKLSADIGFGKVVISTPEDHDKIIAYTSQLPHVLACAYISDPDALRHSGFSGGSFKDISRVADINAALWNELFIENKEFLSAHIELLIENLKKINEYIVNEDSEALTKLLEESKNTKQRIG